MRWQQHERTINVSSKKTLQLMLARVLYANEKQFMFDCMLKPFYIITAFSAGLNQSEMKV